MRILLVAYDNDLSLHGFPMGLAYIAASLLKRGCHVEIYNQDKHHYPEEHLTYYLNKNRFDIIGVSFIAGYYQYRKILKISEAINNSKQRPYYIIGGHGPTPEPEFFLKKTQADIVVMGEGEETIIEILDSVGDAGALSEIEGIAYRKDEDFYVNPRRSLIKDIDNIPFPAYELFPIDYYKLRIPHYSPPNAFSMQMISGRGCTFKCSFCYRMDKGFRPRSSESIIDEISMLKQHYQITDIIFADELLMSSIDRVVHLCENFIKAGLNIRWSCNGRLNYAKPEVLKIMKKAGCKLINYGVEAMDDEVLKNMNKNLTVGQILRGIEATKKAEIAPNINIIFGNIGDNKDILNKGVDLIIKYEDGNLFRTIRPVTPYPGCPLYYYAIEKGLLKDAEDFYENKHQNSDLLTVNFTDMTDKHFYKCLLDANNRLIINYSTKKMETLLEEAKKLYLKKNINFRGFRQ